MNPLRQLIRASLTATLPPDRWLVRGRRRASSERLALSLTFDDGPHPEHTPAVLDALDRWGLTATFFVIGREAERYPALIERIVSAGHSVGNHTFTHSEPRETSSTTFLQEIAQTDALLQTWLPAAPHWVRPPKGELTWSKFRGLWRTGRGIALWNVDPRDYRMTNSDAAAAWAATYRPQAGDIVLMHDRVAAASQIVNALGERGLFDQWQSVSLDNWTVTTSWTPSLALRAGTE